MAVWYEVEKSEKGIENFLMSNYASTNNDLNCLIGMSTAGVLSIIGDTMYAGNAQYFAQFMYITNQ